MHILRHTKGFTLIDMILWLAIFGVLTGTMVSNFRGGSQNESVRLASNLTASLLRRAQTMTLTGAVLSNGDFPDGGYGVYFDTAQTNTLILFADVDGDFMYDPGEELSEDEVVLPANTSFSLEGSMDVVFSPPDGDVYFSGAAVPDTQTISIISTHSEIIRSIVIYRISGQIRES